MSTSSLSPLIDRIAVTQHGIVTREDLLLGGVPPSDVDRALDRRQLVARLPGTYSVTSLPLVWPSSAYAAYRYLERVVRRKHTGDRPAPVVAVTGIAELALRGVEPLEPPRTPLLVTDPASRSRAVCHRHRPGLHRASLEVVDGFVTTGTAWALAEAVGGLRRTSLENTIAWLVREGGWSLDELRDAAARLPPDVAGGLVTVLSRTSDADVRARSGRERVLRRAVVAAGLPGPAVNHVLVLEGEAHEVDLYWPDPFRLIWEVDGPHHERPAQRRRDRRREGAAARAGIRIERCTVQDVDEDLDGVVRSIAHHLGVAPRSVGG